MNFNWGTGQSAPHVGQAELKRPLFSKPPRTQPVGTASGAQTVALPAANPFAAALEQQRRQTQKNGMQRVGHQRRLLVYHLFQMSDLQNQHNL